MLLMPDAALRRRSPPAAAILPLYYATLLMRAFAAIDYDYALYAMLDAADTATMPRYAIYAMIRLRCCQMLRYIDAAYDAYCCHFASAITLPLLFAPRARSFLLSDICYAQQCAECKRRKRRKRGARCRCCQPRLKLRCCMREAVQ